jgi:hypothetical protein
MHTPTFCPKRKFLAVIHLNNVAIIIYSLTDPNYSYFIIKKQAHYMSLLLIDYLITSP